MDKKRMRSAVKLLCIGAIIGLLGGRVSQLIMFPETRKYPLSVYLLVPVAAFLLFKLYKYKKK